MIKPTDSEKRGWAARLLLAEDARWVADIVLSSNGGDEAAYPALLLGHHFVRIAYEGAKAIRSPNADVGCPPLAELLDSQFSEITARARHVSKLLDDNKKSYEQVLRDVRRAYELSHRTFIGKRSRALRWLASDLGLYQIGKQVVGATMPMSYRLALDPSAPDTLSGEDLGAVTREWGSTMSVLMGAAGNRPAVTRNLDLSDHGITRRDCKATRYLTRRFEPVFPIELKLFLLMIESDLNTNRLYLPLTEHGHAGPAFRARVVTLFHSLRALQHIRGKYPSLTSPGARRMQAVVDGPPAQRLLTGNGKKVRNRCVHYQMDDASILPDFTKPMFGLVEAVYPGATWESFDSDVAEVSLRLAEAFAGWQSPRR